MSLFGHGALQFWLLPSFAHATLPINAYWLADSTFLKQCVFTFQSYHPNPTIVHMPLKDTFIQAQLKQLHTHTHWYTQNTNTLCTYISHWVSWVGGCFDTNVIWNTYKRNLEYIQTILHGKLDCGNIGWEHRFKFISSTQHPNSCEGNTMTELLKTPVVKMMPSSYLHQACWRCLRLSSQVLLLLLPLRLWGHSLLLVWQHCCCQHYCCCWQHCWCQVH